MAEIRHMRIPWITRPDNAERIALSSDCRKPGATSQIGNPPMTRETVYVVQAYRAGKGVRVIADTPIRCKSPEAALRTAERLAATKAGVVAFATSGDLELGEYDDEPTVLFRMGRLPAPFQDA
jgi:hypothetical protein